MTEITNEQLEAWAGLGPWKSQGQEPDGVYVIGLRTDKDGVPYDNPTNGLVGAALPFPTELDSGDFTRVLTNAALIAAAPALAAALLAERKAREVEAGELRAALSHAIQAIDGEIPDLDERMCCNGRDCGCYGSTNRCMLLHDLRQALKGQRDE
jgi:hypothetical protein